MWESCGGWKCTRTLGSSGRDGYFCRVPAVDKGLGDYPIYVSESIHDFSRREEFGNVDQKRDCNGAHHRLLTVECVSFGTYDRLEQKTRKNDTDPAIYILSYSTRNTARSQRQYTTTVTQYKLLLDGNCTFLLQLGTFWRLGLAP